MSYVQYCQIVSTRVCYRYLELKNIVYFKVCSTDIAERYEIDFTAT